MKKLSLILFALTALLFTASAQTKYVNLFEEEKVVQLNSIISDINLDKGNAKSIIPLKLPEHTTDFYFVITVVGGKKDAVKSTSLAHQISGLCPANWEAGIINYIDLNKTGRKTNVYILNSQKDANGLANFGYFNYLKKFTNQKSFVGHMKVKTGESYFIGLENIYEMKATSVKVEVVALVSE